jgi:hypothetical protein
MAPKRIKRTESRSNVSQQLERMNLVIEELFLRVHRMPAGKQRFGSRWRAVCLKRSE